MDQKLLDTKWRPLKHPARRARPASLGSMTLTLAAPSWTRVEGGALRRVQKRKEGGLSNDTSLGCQGLQATGHLSRKPSRTKRDRLSRSIHTHTQAYTHTHCLAKLLLAPAGTPMGFSPSPECAWPQTPQDPQLLPTDPQRLPVASTLFLISLPASTSGAQAAKMPCSGGNRAGSVGRRQG